MSAKKKNKTKVENNIGEVNVGIEVENDNQKQDTDIEMVTSTAKLLNIRSYPSVGSSVITIVPLGTILKVLEKNIVGKDGMEWLKVTGTPGPFEGYVLKSLTTKYLI